MGCLLGCFGLSSKRKRRKLPSRILPRDHGSSYEQLDSSGSANIVSINSDSDQRKSKEPLHSKIRKKVRFNLNVKAYEPIPSWEGDEEGDDKATESCNERGKTLQPSCGAAIATEMASYPSNYRYRNCIYSYDEEDVEEEDLYDADSDLDFDEDLYEEDDDDAEDDQENDIEELRRRTRTIGIEEEEVVEHSTLDSKQRRSRWPEVMDQQNVREKNQYVHSVLNPVENLAQWKEVKAKGKLKPPSEEREKENTMELQLNHNHAILSVQEFAVESNHAILSVQEFAVESSLANWLISPATCQTKSCARSCRREEALGITDITNLST